jgi:hypothetical protein
MTWWTEDEAQETIFRCVDLLTGEVVSLADEDQTEVERGDKSIVGGIRSTQSRGQTDDHVRARPDAQSR